MNASGIDKKPNYLEIFPRDAQCLLGGESNYSILRPCFTFSLFYPTPLFYFFSIIFYIVDNCNLLYD